MGVAHLFGTSIFHSIDHRRQLSTHESQELPTEPTMIGRQGSIQSPTYQDFLDAATHQDQPSLISTVIPDDVDDDENDHFDDAPENMVASDDYVDEPSFLIPGIENHAVFDSHSITDGRERAFEIDDDDLFGRTFGKYTTASDSEDSDQDDTSGKLTVPVSQDDTAAPIDTPSESNVKSNMGKTSSQTSDITVFPEAKPNFSSTIVLDDSNKNKITDDNNTSLALPSLGPPDPVKNLSTNLRKHKKIHQTAKQLIPRLPLAEHRYWIGIINIDVNPKRLEHEKHFTWMRGNRFTTVETVWHKYQESTAVDEFVLLLGMERVEFVDLMEELDLFGDRFVCLRAVREKSADAKGVDLLADVVPQRRVERMTEVIEID